MWDNCTPPPSPCRLARALLLAGALLGDYECFYLRRRFHFVLSAGWSIAISTESAGRFRVEACQLSRPRNTLWSLDGEDEHLAGAILELTAFVEQAKRHEIMERDCLH